jgi:hypothetical protein
MIKLIGGCSHLISPYGVFMGVLRFFRSMFIGHLVVSMWMSSCGVPVSYSYALVVLVFLF